MQKSRYGVALLGWAAAIPCAVPSYAQHESHAADTAPHAMWSTRIGERWQLTGMAQLFPIVTIGAPGVEQSPLRRTHGYLTQPALMLDFGDVRQRVVLRTTLNFEAFTLEDGELTFGAWGEGFIDKRHPHTFLHELMVSVNLWSVGGGDVSLSAGKGFAPFGTDDPMSRPGLKYPTNHHLSQILERWTVNAVYLRSGWSVEAGLFGGTEPAGPHDLSNIESFGDSWSTRIAKRWGGGTGPMAAWELAASYGYVVEEHEELREHTALWNAALRHVGSMRTSTVYAMIEASRSEPEHDDSYFSILGEAGLAWRGHQPYGRIEYATRPEYTRAGMTGDAFFRYDHDDEPIGATRWAIATLGYGYEATEYPVSVRPFAEAQLHRVGGKRGGISPRALFERNRFWSVSFGARIFLGGDPMRMGAYGVLDPMTAMHRDMSMPMHDAGHVPMHDRER
ncbi:MAG TPA: hypothetical protein VMN60_09260 [Longimicrobiales bacterium]|nr:hypothetical protein [Longimicrobiales bacterium]